MKECFVIMPMLSGKQSNVFLKRYKAIIKSAVEGLRINGKQVFHCVRSDEVARSGSITQDVLRRLNTSDVVIADLSLLNPNVFYELGVRHALRSGTILICEEGGAPPFDIRDLQVISYETGKGKQDLAIKRIQEVLKCIAEDDCWSDSPVAEAIADQTKSAGGFKTLRETGCKRQDDGTYTSPLEGRWVEILDRYEKGKRARHFSIFDFLAHPSGIIHPFMMNGWSYKADASRHSHWETRYLRMELKDKTIAVEYIFSAVVTDADPVRSYGISRFFLNGSAPIVEGMGHYFAGEEKTPYKCKYKLKRITKPINNMDAFVRGLNRKYGAVPLEQI